MFVTISRSAVYIKCKTMKHLAVFLIVNVCFVRWTIDMPENSMKSSVFLTCAYTCYSKKQEHWKPLNLLVQWQHAAAWQIKLHEKSGCFLLHSSVSLFCDVRDKNVTWFFHSLDLHEFFKISLFLLTKCWSLTNSSEENLLAEIAFSFYWEPKPTATDVKIQRWVFYLQNKKLCTS